MLTEAERYAFALRCLQGAQCIARRVTTPAVHHVLRFLLTETRLIVPTQEKRFAVGRYLEHSLYPKDPEVWLYVWEQRDLPHLPENCARELGLSDPRQLGFYHHPNRFLVLNGNIPISEFCGGMLILHEGYHAWKQIVGQIPRLAPPTKDHEYETLATEHTWLREFGGEVFFSIMRQWSDMIRVALGDRAPSTYASFRFPDFPYPAPLDFLMGPAASPTEIHLRLHILRRHALFSLVQDLRLSRSEEHEALGAFL